MRMWRLMTTPVWHSAPCILMKRDAVPAWRYYRHFATTPGSVFVSVGYSLTMAPVIGRNASRGCVIAWDSSTCAPNLTHPKRMAKQSASFRQRYVNGLMRGAMTHQCNGQNTYNRGCMSTTGIVLMQVWATSPPSVVFSL
ncbi:hypothetical protein D3C80_1270100 [compost metagenome]